MSATAEQDLGPLAWVLDEVRKSLEAATKAVSRFMRDADAARLSDLEELDTSALRIARQQLHQACGALEMVGVTARRRCCAAWKLRSTALYSVPNTARRKPRPRWSARTLR
jgi:hypothetical protein